MPTKQATLKAKQDIRRLSKNAKQASNTQG
jgi:hypothetical protein